MATVPPGPSTVPPSPAPAAPFPAAEDCEAGREDGESAVYIQDCGISTVNRPPSVTDVNKSVKKKQSSMLARASPALHLSMQRDPQLNGLSTPTEDTEPQHLDSTHDSPRTTDNGDNCSSGCYTAIRTSEHEGQSSLSKSPALNNSINGMPAFTRTEEPPEPSPKHPLPQEPSPEEPPAAELSRLQLASSDQDQDHGIRYVRYESELQMPWIMRLITKDLSEPYSIYTYRYFIHNWPQLCFLAMVEQECVGAIVCKLDMHKKMFRRGYIAMLAVDSKHRRKSIGTNLVKKAIYAMVEGDCDEVVLETEITNKSALKLYENLGFVRDKRLFRYYLNGVDALRLKLWLR
ncbi:unnamed protein product [Knipowitschia caucasica]|uniref:N-alpha-acetyltransferase 30 n=1 Tax=Knipowitschia caucasica TaxID=637954 RepID=A0AAV2KC35_KNICA